MKLKILLTILLIVMVVALHFYFIPTTLNDVAVNQVNDSIDSTSNMRVTTTIFDYSPIIAFFALIFIWWKPIANAIKKLNLT